MTNKLKNKSIVFLRKGNIADYLGKEFNFRKFTLQEYANLIAIHHNSLLVLEATEAVSNLMEKTTPPELKAAQKMLFNAYLSYLSASQDIHPHSLRELATIIVSSSGVSTDTDNEVNEVEEDLKYSLKMLAEKKKEWN
jgi:hypothetical protein